MTPAATAQIALREAIMALTAAAIPDAPRDARLLLAHAMGIGADRVTLHLHDALSPDQSAAFAAAIAARLQRQPVSQIIGQRAFWGRVFRVTPDVLDPRPETETLIAAALAVAFTRVLDLGTGSGAILLTLLAERPDATGVGVDVSPVALSVAQGNADHLGLTSRASFIASDWFGAVTGRFDLIVSNPPYIAADEMPGLSPEVLKWEPHIALTPGGDGLDAYRAIAAGAGDHLAPGGWLMAEIGPTQGPAVLDLFEQAGLLDVRCQQDLDGRDRVVLGRGPDGPHLVR